MNNIDYKKELISLLKSDDEVKTAMEKLEFGCRLKLKNYNEIIKIYYLDISKDLKVWYISWVSLDWVRVFNIINIDDIYEIIWLPLQERFIRMYLNNKWIKFTIEDSVLYIRIVKWDWYITSSICELDNNLDFDNQSEETYKQIFLAIKEL